MSGFPDHFSATAASYAHYRPHYPAALFQWLAGRVPDARRVWDCGTGNGQAASGLGAHFDQVVASDPSVAQLAHASRSPTVHYVAMTAERAALADRSIDLVTVAQALHWFDRPLFYREVSRVLRPGGVLAVWSYGRIDIGDDLDPEVARFYTDIVGSYWPAERSLVDTGYAGVEFPFPEEPAPRFEMAAEWTLSMLAGYVSTWSAVNRYRAARGDDPLPGFIRRIAPAWGPADQRRTVKWPLIVRLGRRPDHPAA